MSTRTHKILAAAVFALVGLIHLGLGFLTAGGIAPAALVAGGLMLAASCWILTRDRRPTRREVLRHASHAVEMPGSRLHGARALFHTRDQVHPDAAWYWTVPRGASSPQLALLHDAQARPLR